MASSRRPPLPKLGSLIRSHLFSGIFVIIPIAVIGWILGKVLALLWGLRGLLPDAWRPDNFLVNLAFTVGTTFLLTLGLSLLGWASKQYLGQKVLEFLAEIIQRIPVLRSIYGALDQLLKAMASGGGQQFSRVVYIEWPRKGMWVLAFVTGPAKGASVPPHHLNVFLPATPNPTSGFHLIVSEKEVIETQMRVEDAFRTILSLGIAQGEPKNDKITTRR